MGKFSAGGGGGLASIESHVMCYFWVYMIHYSCLYDPAKTARFGKIFLKLLRKCPCPIRLQGLLSFNITKTI